VASFCPAEQDPALFGEEGEARDYVREVAESVGAEVSEDAYGNTVVRAAARAGARDQRLVAVQVHLHMVCVAAPGVVHDFDHDPIVPRCEGDKVSASGTTLGADNGIGVAAALALLTEPDLACGPVELLFTVEEDWAAWSASLRPALLQATSLINLDSENDKALTVGCAGGTEIVLRLDRSQRVSRPIGSAPRNFSADGLSAIDPQPNRVGGRRKESEPYNRHING